MIEGQVTLDGTPLVHLPIGASVWPALIDTGFNGALELPEVLRSVLPHEYAGQVISVLATGRRVVEDS